ncbi:hypothetical protein [Candidatus Amarolinea dominans]|uniref:hypothetical protein n=1 Tax=Candidatus Amarolinea dominans TaxID=3140696 RepID=UPI0031CCD6ED
MTLMGLGVAALPGVGQPRAQFSGQRLVVRLVVLKDGIVVVDLRFENVHVSPQLITSAIPAPPG